MNSQQFKQWCQQSIAPINLPLTYFRKPLTMGILNATPDSFSDGGRFLKINHAYDHAMTMINQGVDIIDIGGESSRPGAEPLPLEEELERVVPIIERIRAVSDICISIDTYKADVMEATITSGANIINDIKALKAPNALAVAARLKVPVCLMHMQGEPKTMQANPQYDQDIITEINDFFQQRIEACIAAGIAREHLILDPGFGFGKSVANNLCIVKQFNEFQKHRLPLLLGVSRKSTIGTVLKKEITERLTGGLTMAVFAALQGVSIIRTHDVDETNQALQMLDAIVGTRFPPTRE